MPQPLSKVAPNATIIDDEPSDVVLLRRPELALKVAGALASWSAVEFDQLCLYLRLLLGPARDQGTAAITYLALETQSAKSAAILAVARWHIAEHTRPLLHAILALIKSGQKRRDKIAHHVWVESSEPVEGMVLVDPKVLLRNPIDTASAYVYKERDFDEITAANKRLSDFCHRFRAALNLAPGDEAYQKYAGLCGEPEIRERLDRQA